VCVILGFGLGAILIAFVSERCWADSRWSAFLEPGPLLEHTAQCMNDNDCKQVDDDGESYWIFESRDVGRRLSICPFLMTLSTLFAQQPSRPANPIDSR
jgi:hypothetical protein